MGLSTARALAVMIAGTLALGGGFVALIYLSVRQILILRRPRTLARLELRARHSRARTQRNSGTSEYLSDRFVLQASGAILHAVSSAVLQLVILITLFVFSCSHFRGSFYRARGPRRLEPLFAPLLAVRQDLWSFLVIRTKVNAFMAIPPRSSSSQRASTSPCYGSFALCLQLYPIHRFALATIHRVVRVDRVRAYRAIAVVLVLSYSTSSRIRALPSIRRQRAQHPPWSCLFRCFSGAGFLARWARLLPCPSRC